MRLDEFLAVKCPSCAKEVLCPPESRGQEVQCPLCKSFYQKEVWIPVPLTAVAAQAPTASTAPSGPSTQPPVSPPGTPVWKDSDYLAAVEALKELTDFTRVLPRGQSDWRSIVNWITKLDRAPIPRDPDLRGACHYAIGKALVCLGLLNEARAVFRRGSSDSSNSRKSQDLMARGQEGLDRMPSQNLERFGQLEAQMDTCSKTEVREAIRKWS
jgi:hypothetical protein